MPSCGECVRSRGPTRKPEQPRRRRRQQLPGDRRHDALAAGAHEYVIKPFTADAIRDKLALLGLLPQERMDGQYLSVLMEGGNLEPRDHFTLGYADHVWARDDRYLMFSHRDRSEPHLYDLQNDPETRNDLAGQDPDRVRRMFDDYVLADAGGRRATLAACACSRGTRSRLAGPCSG